MSSRKVLIVDDDRVICKQLAKELKRNFFSTFEASDGKEALEIFGKENVDIVLLDVKLPDQDGLEVLEKIKAEKPDCEVIVITGFGTQEIAIQSLRRGAVDYIEKPIKMDELTAALGRAHERLQDKEALSYKNIILVLDDEEDVVKMLKRFLEKEGYEVFTAYKGEDGIKIIEGNKIDVVITDIKMKDMDGIEVIKQAKNFYQDIEGIVVTGYKDEKLAIQALRAGAIDYINKPINIDGLLFSVKKAIERINLNRNRLYRNRELKISSEIIAKMNEELERRIEERSRELNRTQSQLFQTSKLATLGEMSAGLAHEMNQPLGGISLIVTSLRKLLEKGRLTDEEIKSGIKEIEASVERMSRVIQHIRTFARQDTLRFVEVKVNATIDSAMSLLGEQLRLHEIEVALELGEDLPRVNGEPYQLEQVWINLISNARDALDDKGRLIDEGRMPKSSYNKKLIISTAFDADSKTIQVSFADNGRGIPKEKKDKIFDPFFTTKEVGKGSGLGLSISYGIIESHKGSIKVDSKENEGTTVTVMLPTLPAGGH